MCYYVLSHWGPFSLQVTRILRLISRHLKYYPTGNSSIRSADPENPCLEPNMEWIGCTVCEIFVCKLYCDLEWGSGSLKVIESGTIGSADPENLT